MEIGKSVEDGVVQNLTDAAMGTKTLGQAAISVLNDLKRKLIEVAIQQAVTGLGNFLGNALVGLFTGGLGGRGYSITGGASRTTASGTNIGKVSGQSILHCHLHLIPRREGDVDNPQGGVRSVIPNKQHYKRNK